MLQNSFEAISTDVLSLPSTWIARSGFDFCPMDDQWTVPDSTRTVVLRFDELRPYYSGDVLSACKKTFLWYLKNRSPMHANNMFQRFKHFSEAVVSQEEPLASITSRHIINYRAALSRNHEWYLGALSGFFKKWRELGYIGIGSDTYALLRNLTIEGNRKGWAILTMDPVDGPLTELELNAIHQAVNASFSKGNIGSRQFSLVWLFLATGARAVQISDLKIKDFFVRKTSSGTVEYLINMPRAKQRNALRRSSLKLRPLVREIGEVLESWVEQLKLEAAHRGDGSVEIEGMPLFPSWNKLNPPGFEHHSNSLGIDSEMKKIFWTLKIFSHRTGERAKLNLRRFRYTLGTRAAQEKLGPLVIAEMLDHNDTQNVLVYTKATPEIIEQIDEALAKELAPLAQAFAGKIVLSDAEATRADDPASLVRQPGGTPGQDGVGRCGRCGTCSAPAPIACYTCGNFQAWLEGPHEEVLKGLIAERQRVMEITGDERIAHVNDHVILAVAQVVEMCKKIRGGQEVTR